MIKVSEYTWRKSGSAECPVCSSPISLGDQYREMIGVNVDIWDTDFVRRVAHVDCVLDREEWEVTTESVIASRADSRLDYIRTRYKVPAWYGRRVLINVGLFAGKHGTVVDGGITAKVS